MIDKQQTTIRRSARTTGGKRIMRRSLNGMVVLWAVLALLVGACANTTATTTAAAVTTTSAAATTTEGATTTAGASTTTAAEGSLVGICPDPLVVQTDWFIEPEHGYTYQMIGPDGTIDAANGVYSGPLGDTGITLEIRQGGPFIDFASPIAQMYQDDDIFMGYADTADVTANFGNLPAVHVFAPLDIGPQILMWDPEANQFDSFEDIRDSGIPVLYFEGGKYMDFLIHEGLLSPDQIDASYDGSPTRFVTEEVVQQGFATNEPYRYENDIQEWLKPVDFILTHDSGFEIYQSAMSVKLDRLEANRDCLAGVVPLMQQALVDYISNPKPINDMMVRMVTEMATFWTLSEGGTADAVDKMKSLNMVSNVDNGTIGDMDAARIQALIEKINPIFLEQGLEGYVEGLTADRIATNDFLDPSIGLP
jgi:hypothetical protein